MVKYQESRSSPQPPLPHNAAGGPTSPHDNEGPSQYEHAETESLQFFEFALEGELQRLFQQDGYLEIGVTETNLAERRGLQGNRVICVPEKVSPSPVVSHLFTLALLGQYTASPKRG